MLMKPEAHIQAPQFVPEVYQGTVYGAPEATPAEFDAAAYNATEVSVATGAAILNAESYDKPGVQRGVLYAQYNSANDPMLIAAAARQSEIMLSDSKDADFEDDDELAAA